LHPEGDQLHVLGAVVGAQNLTSEDESHRQRDQGDHENHGDEGQIAC
jgi:hypothetical protein